MPSLDMKTVIRYFLGAAVGCILGVAFSLLYLRSDPITILGEDMYLTTGGNSVLREIVPLTEAAALQQGWEDPVRCFKRKGRYFQKENTDGSTPYLLQFNSSDVLLAIYLYSLVEMPSPPWQYEDKGLIGVKNMGVVHWSLPVFFRDPIYACGKISSLGST